MKNKLIGALLVAFVMAFFTTGSVFAVEAFKIKTELIQHDPLKAQPGYVVFSGPINSAGVPSLVIINMEGEVVHSIDVPGLTKIQYAYLLENGNFLVEGSEPGRPSSTTSPIIAGGPGSTIKEIDWMGNVVWEFEAHDENYNWTQHHDMRKIWNSKLGEYTYIFLAWEYMTAQDALKLGFDPSKGKGQAADGVWSPTCIYEVNQAREIIWRWAIADHLVTNFADNAATSTFTSDGPLGRSFSAPAIGEPSDYPGKMDINSPYCYPGTVGPTKDWNHCNSLDYNPESGQIVMNSKHMSEIFVIDHDNTFVSNTNWKANWKAASSDAGDFLYRFGNPANYATKEVLPDAAPGYHYAGHHQFWAAHNIQWIGGGYYDGWEPVPGHGNFLIFDNNTWDPIEHKSRIIEWNPFLDANGNNTGNYVNPPDAGYNGNLKQTDFNVSNQTTWFYKARYSSFYSAHISGAQRMPNGNTFIISGAQGHMFEVTNAQYPNAEVVWEYLSPVGSDGINEYMTDKQGGFTGTGAPYNNMFRAYKIPEGHPGLRHHKYLVPQGTIVEPDSYTGFGFGGGIGGSGGGGGSGSGGAGGGGGY